MIKDRSLVRVKIKPDELHGQEVAKFNGQQFLVSKVKRLRTHDTYGYMYELRGCVSEKGIPYTFVEEWLEVLV